MECREFQERLSAYIEGLIPATEKVLLEDHLQACAGCRGSLADLKKTIEYVQETPEVEPPAWLTQKVMARVREEAEAEARKSIWEKLFHRAPAWQTERATATVYAKPEAGPRKTIWEKLFYPIPVKLPLEAAGVIAIAVVTIYVFKGIQPEIRLSRGPFDETRAPTISEVQKPAAPPSSTQERQKAISDKSIEPKRVIPPEQQTPLGRLDAPAPSPAAPAPAERYEEPSPTAGADGKGELTRQAPSSKEETSPALDLAKGKDQWRTGAPSADHEVEMAKRPAEKPPIQEQQGVQGPALAPKQNQAMPLAGTEAKRDESKLETLPAAPRGEAGYEARAEQRSEGLPLSAAPVGKALAEKKETGIHLTLAVQDIDAARSAIEKSLAELGGRIIKAESQEKKILLTAELSSNQLDRLLNKLKPLGEVKEEVARPEAKEGAITIMRIEISGRPIE